MHHHRIADICVTFINTEYARTMLVKNIKSEVYFLWLFNEEIRLFCMSQKNYVVNKLQGFRYNIPLVYIFLD